METVAVFDEIEVIPTSECILAESIEDKVGRLGVLTNRYFREDYLKDIHTVHIDNEDDISKILENDGFDYLVSGLNDSQKDDFLKDGLIVEYDNKKLYIDKYNWDSVPFVTKLGDLYTGSARLIKKDGRFGLPTTSEKAIEIGDAWKEKVGNSPVEFSQFAIVRGAPKETSALLLRAVYEYSNENEIDSWIATTDNSVVRLLNSAFFNFNIPNVGPSVEYLGSLSTPIYIDLEGTLENAEKYEGSKKMADFIRGRTNELQ